MVIVILIIVFTIAYFLLHSNGDINHVSGAKWVHINNVSMSTPQAQEVFNYFKSMLLDKKMMAEEVLRDVNLRRHYNNVRINKESLSDDENMTYIDAVENAFFNFGGTIAPDWFILNPNEECYFSSEMCAVDTIKKIARNITYNGIKVYNGAIRLGSGTIYSNDVEGLKRFDAGTIIVTNQRIVFKGTMKNKTIPIGNIISIDNFDDNGVIISMSNRENPVVIRFIADKCFLYNKNADIRFFYNDLNWFYKAIEKSFYKRLVPKEVQEVRAEMDSVNFKIARKTMIDEGLERESN